MNVQTLREIILFGSLKETDIWQVLKNVVKNFDEFPVKRLEHRRYK